MHLTTVQRNGTTPSVGLNVWDTDLLRLFVGNGTTWLESTWRPMVYRDANIYINNSSLVWLNVVTKAIPIDELTTHLITLSFNHNADSTTGDFTARATFNGLAVDLNDRVGDPQGEFQIIRVEVKDSANSPGGAITGTGSGQKLGYTAQFVVNGVIGTPMFLLDILAEQAGVNVSIWNIVLRVEKCTIF